MTLLKKEESISNMHCLEVILFAILPALFSSATEGVWISGWADEDAPSG